MREVNARELTQRIKAEHGTVKCYITKRGVNWHTFKNVARGWSTSSTITDMLKEDGFLAQDETLRLTNPKFLKRSAA